MMSPKELSNMFNEEQLLKIKSYILERFTVSAQARINLNIPPENFEVFLREASYDLVVQIASFFMGGKRDARIQMTHFLSWKDRFKHDNRYKWYMRWWVKHYPPKKRVDYIPVSHYIIFPEIPIPPTFKNKTQFHIHTAERGEPHV